MADEMAAPEKSGAAFSTMRTEWVIRNPHATMPLCVPLDIECNTSEEKILANVLANSKIAKTWLAQREAHHGTAVIVGGGPSLADTVEDIRQLHDGGAEIFALNGAARYLANQGITPDYQVIIDAQTKTADLIGPAWTHIFASQVDQQCFLRQPDALLFHVTHGNLLPDEQDGFPKHDAGYCIIGGAVSVGNTALVLTWAMGYRELHVFGMDSSHREGDSHAYRQDMNEGDPCTIVELDGREYICSLPMRLQAVHFMERARQLIENGCTIEVYGDGLLPDAYRHPDKQIRSMLADL